MNNPKLEGWTDYWNLFDQLCLILTENKKDKMVSELKIAKTYVNGFTDGWHEFLEKFQMTVDDNVKMLNPDEKGRAEFLIKSLKKSLDKR